MIRVAAIAAVVLFLCSSQNSFAGNSANTSKVTGLASRELKSFCDSVTSQILNSPDSSFNLHLGELVVKDSREIAVRGDTALAFVIGCVGKAELLLLKEDTSDFAIPDGRLQFILPGLHAVLSTVDLNADGTPELRIDMSGGMGAPWSIFVSIGTDSLEIIRPAPEREAFHTLHGSVVTVDRDGDGLLEIVEYESDGTARIYRFNKKGGRYELDEGVHSLEKQSTQ